MLITQRPFFSLVPFCAVGRHALGQCHLHWNVHDPATVYMLGCHHHVDQAVRQDAAFIPTRQAMEA
eukprot:scaffold477204_cov17-Prasinocladus_malaysianus.AAC.1